MKKIISIIMIILAIICTVSCGNGAEMANDATDSVENKNPVTKDDVSSEDYDKKRDDETGITDKKDTDTDTSVFDFDTKDKDKSDNNSVNNNDNIAKDTKTNLDASISFGSYIHLPEISI